MSRSGYVDDMEEWELIRWRGAVASAMRGRRGQAFLKELLAAMDALPKRELIAEELEADGEVCAIGAVGRARGLDMSEIDPTDFETIAQKFGVAEALAREIFFMNDEAHWSRETPAARFARMRLWVEGHIK